MGAFVVKFIEGWSRVVDVWHALYEPKEGWARVVFIWRAVCMCEEGSVKLVED